MRVRPLVVVLTPDGVLDSAGARGDERAERVESLAQRANGREPGSPVRREREKYLVVHVHGLVGERAPSTVGPVTPPCPTAWRDGGKRAAAPTLPEWPGAAPKAGNDPVSRALDATTTIWRFFRPHPRA
jgi:hypothetical protein